MTTKTFPRVPGIDLCKSKGKNVVFEAGINKVQKGSKMWLGFDGAYLRMYHSSLHEHVMVISSGACV
jgi:hypothetical protein